MREMEKFFEDYEPPLTLIFTALHVISLTILVLEIYRKEHRIFSMDCSLLSFPWTAVLVFYPIYLLYEILKTFLFSHFSCQRTASPLIATKLLNMICLVLIWIAAFLYRKKQKEQNFANSHMVVCSGKIFYKNQAENRSVNIESENV